MLVCLHNFANDKGLLVIKSVKTIPKHNIGLQGFANNPNVVISRCDLPENLLAGGCPGTSLLNPRSSYELTSK